MPYKGGAPASVAAAAGEVPMGGMARSRSAMPQIKAGRVSVLAVTTAKRSASTNPGRRVQEAGGPRTSTPSIWAGLFAPKGMPQPIIDKIYDGDRRDPADAGRASEKFAAGGGDTGGMKPAEFAAMIKREAARLPGDRPEGRHQAGVSRQSACDRPPRRGVSSGRGP